MIRKKAKLGDILTLRRESVKLIPGKIYRRITVRLWGNGATLRDEVEAEKIKTSTQFLVRKGQFIFSKIDARNGAFAIVPEELDQAVVSGNFLTLECNEKLILTEYLSYLILRPKFWAMCAHISEGTTNRLPVRIDEFLKLEINLPEVNEQKLIINKLRLLLKEIEVLKILQSENQKYHDLLVLSVFRQITNNTPKRALGEVAPLTRRPIEIDKKQNYPQISVRSFGRVLFIRSLS